MDILPSQGKGAQYRRQRLEPSDVRCRERRADLHRRLELKVSGLVGEGLQTQQRLIRLTRSAAMGSSAVFQIAELDQRIERLRAEIREVADRAASAAGNASEERLSDMLASQEEQLRELISAREKIGPRS
jgi:DNA anti-recombination protein RmuC